MQKGRKHGSKGMGHSVEILRGFTSKKMIGQQGGRGGEMRSAYAMEKQCGDSGAPDGVTAGETQRGSKREGKVFVKKRNSLEKKIGSP